jgi:hypothetical protein
MHTIHSVPLGTSASSSSSSRGRISGRVVSHQIQLVLLLLAPSSNRSH